MSPKLSPQLATESPAAADARLRAIERALLALIPPEKRAQVLRRMMAALDADECSSLRAEWESGDAVSPESRVVAKISSARPERHGVESDTGNARLRVPEQA